MIFQSSTKNSFNEKEAEIVQEGEEELRSLFCEECGRGLTQ